MDFLLYFILSYPLFLIKYLLLSLAGLLALIFALHFIDKKANRPGDQENQSLEEQK